MNQRFPNRVQQLLIAAGWFPGRCVELPVLPKDFVLFDAAEKALHEFGGLKIAASAEGVDFFGDGIVFLPAVAEGLSPGTGLIAKNGKRIFPLGGFFCTHAVLFIDEDGEAYDWFDDVELVAPSLDQALVKLLLGIR